MDKQRLIAAASDSLGKVWPIFQMQDHLNRIMYMPISAECFRCDSLRNFEMSRTMPLSPARK